MKTKRISLKTSMALFLGILLIGCSAEDGMDGAPGPQGEQGPVGPQGEQGEQGIQGEPGEDGNANVIASPWIPEQFSDSPASYTIFSVADEAFTDEILNSGTVLVYARDGIETIPVPVVFGNQSYYYVLPDTLGEITFIARTLDNTTMVFGVLTDFRYVIIPASNITGKDGQPMDFRKMTYFEVMDYFGLSY